MDNKVTKGDVKNSLQNQKLTTLQMTKSLLSNEMVKKRFEEILGKKAYGFIASVLSLVAGVIIYLPHIFVFLG